jgi:hypothetical protein
MRRWIGETTRWLVGMTRWLAELTRWIVGMTRWIGEMTRWLAEMMRWLGEITRWLADMMRWPGGMTRWLAEMMRWLGEITRWLADMMRWPGGMMRWLAEITRWLGDITRWVGEMMREDAVMTREDDEIMREDGDIVREDDEIEPEVEEIDIPDLSKSRSDPVLVSEAEKRRRLVRSSPLARETKRIRQEGCEARVAARGAGAPVPDERDRHVPRELGEYLPADPARRSGSRPLGDDRARHGLALPRRHHLRDGAALCADARPVRGVLDVAPDEDLAVLRRERGPDAVARVGRVSSLARATRSLHQPRHHRLPL